MAPAVLAIPAPMTTLDGSGWSGTGAWKNRKLKTETDTEMDGGNGNTQAIIT